MAGFLGDGTRAVSTCSVKITNGVGSRGSGAAVSVFVSFQWPPNNVAVSGSRASFVADQMVFQQDDLDFLDYAGVEKPAMFVSLDPF